MRRIALLACLALAACSGDRIEGPPGPRGPSGPAGEDGAPGPAGELVWIQFDVTAADYGDHYGGRYYKVVMLNDPRISSRTFVNAYVQQGRDSVEEYIPVDLWLRSQERFDPVASGPILFVQEYGGVWIADPNLLLRNHRLWVAAVVPAG